MSESEKPPASLRFKKDTSTGRGNAGQRAVVTLQFQGSGDLDAAIRDLTELIARFAQGTASVIVADRARPVVGTFS